MKIEILGTGCHKCLALELQLVKAIAQSGHTDVQVVREENERSIRHYMPLENTPGLLIDGYLISQREVPTVETLVGWLKAIPAT